jgi:hypothetical protein
MTGDDAWALRASAAWGAAIGEALIRQAESAGPLARLPEDAAIVPLDPAGDHCLCWCLRATAHSGVPDARDMSAMTVRHLGRGAGPDVDIPVRAMPGS